MKTKSNCASDGSVTLQTAFLEWNCPTAAFKKVATFNTDFALRDGNRTHQNAFRSCDTNFVRKTIEIERRKNFDS